MKYLHRRFLGITILVVNLLVSLQTYADGSKNWTLQSTLANQRRVFLRSSTVASPNWPFPNLGTHYVYAKAGERITLASSLQNTGTSGNNNKRILLYSPTGNLITLDFASGGRIQNRTEEVAGPLLYNQAAGSNRYIPAYYLVPVGGDGIYRVEFLSTYTPKSSSDTYNISQSIDAKDNWVQSPTTTTVTVAAWDVSVINTANNAFISGRVYTNVLNLSTGNINPNTTGFHGLVNVRTKDGYTYQVDNNGNNGMYFTFFVNNNGFVDATTQLPIYKSINTTSNLGQRVHNPNNADKGTHLTHKLFYTSLADDLPVIAPVAVTSDGGSSWITSTTWLKTTPIIPEVSKPTLTGVDGEIGQVSNKGGYIIFNADVQGNYRIEIIGTGTPSFPTRTITGQASAGTNSILWDGKDGAGNPLPTGTFPAKVTVQLQGAEVLFPFFDMEYNRLGTIIQLTNGPVDTDPYKVYWNDTDISDTSNGSGSTPKNNSHLPPTNSVGINSKTNGHIWGLQGTGTSGQFGDNKSIDTWAFITGEKKEATSNVTVKTADLKVTQLITDKEDVEIGDRITYTIKVKNGESGDGNSDTKNALFSFILPLGFEPDVDFTPLFSGNGCGMQSLTGLTYNAATHTYSSSLDLPNGCEITYIFKAKVTEASDPASTQAVATILRPKDVTDPDATNIRNPDKPMVPDPNKPFEYENYFGDYYFPPTNPFFECKYNGLGGTCNNIKTKTVSLIRRCDLAIDKSVDEPVPEIGNEVTFTLRITNHGPHNAMNIIITDVVPDGYSIKTINNGGIQTGNTITWNISGLIKDADLSVNFTAIVLDKGNYQNVSTVIGDGEDSDLTNNTDTETVTPCKEENIFTEDFGISDFGVNVGRTTSPYMPSGSFTFGIPYPQSSISNETAIDNDHYAVVAPGYIKAGWKTGDLGWYFWTPAYDEANTVTDRSGQVNGAVMVINAGNTLQSFYDRPQLLQVGATYRASFWLYLMKGPSSVAIDVKHAKTGEVLATITSPVLEDWDSKVKQKWNYIDLYFTVPVPDDKENCEVDNVIISFRNNKGATYGNDYYIDDISLDKVCSPPPGTVILNCPNPDYMKNYWYGTISNDWASTDNWTKNIVPTSGEDIEFATEINNGNGGTGNGKGAAIRDLFLDTDRIIGNLVNNSDVDLVVTPENQLTINGTVTDTNANNGNIIIKADPDKATGTLIFTNPPNNTTVNAIVEFYNKAYECATCGFYKKQWQYFGIPVQSSDFPYLDPKVETINEWVEPYIYSNKWRPAPYTPDLSLKAFKGYEITNNTNAEPTHIYRFPGILNVGDATVGVTRTLNVNYSGMNLIANSFTAAIPITSAAISHESVELESNTVYLFNIGTRDQWRKLNGGSADGIAAGQYQAVPFNLAGQAGIPDRILSMHTFMLDVTTPGNITLKYDQLVKNDLNESTIKPWKSAQLRSSSSSELPHVIVDVISNESADRVWLFENHNTTTGFDNGWDGYKIKEGELIQAYIPGSDQSDYQIATVPDMNGTVISIRSEAMTNYSISLSVSPEVESRNLFLKDLFTGRNYPIVNDAEYVIAGFNTSKSDRFKIMASTSGIIEDKTESSLINIYVRNNIITINNQSEEDCIAIVYDLMGKLVMKNQVRKNGITEFSGSPSVRQGIYIVKVLGENNSINKTDRVLLR